MWYSTIKTTNSELKKVFTSFVWMEHPSPLLKYERPIAHTEGIYGFNFYVYYVPEGRWDGIAILSGDRCGNMKVKRSFELEDKYSNMIKETDTKEDVRQYLIKFISELIIKK